MLSSIREETEESVPLMVEYKPLIRNNNNANRRRRSFTIHKRIKSCDVTCCSLLCCGWTQLLMR